MTTEELTGTVLALDGKKKLPKALVGGKAHSLNRMSALGMPVPPAFTITMNVCPVYHRLGQTLPETVWQEVLDHLSGLERAVGRGFGSAGLPLLVSVRSGAARSMPGMMDTVLNLGLTEPLRDVLAAETGDAHWAADTWERFRRSYTAIVGVLPSQNPHEQLRAAIGAVFKSWFSERAMAYRDRHGIKDLLGTAVTVQAMVFGNRDDRSGTGVVFSRNPVSGEPGLFGEWLSKAQGEDVVSGERTPLPAAVLAKEQPENYRLLTELAVKLEADAREMVDIEFTIESGRLYLLQARVGKRSARAAARIAVDMVAEGLITEVTALDRITVDQARQLTKESVIAHDPVALSHGIAATPGIGSGIAVTDTDEAMQLAAQGKSVVLVRPSTSPADVPAMFTATAVVTEQGGTTSHAALVCRELDLPCVVGCGEGASGQLAGRHITVDGNTGRIHLGGIRPSMPQGTLADGGTVIETLTAWAAKQDGGRTPEPRSLTELLAMRDRLRAVGNGSM
ncbi:pyruvate, phosphate dikinase [Streptomyces sp. NPDC059680]|uniref:pyruvate, phosphate dikinase n=1 Tax=Streptomyces sp. NPDC059680 TaxID=3346904 RepID=UPI00367AFF0A